MKKIFFIMFFVFLNITYANEQCKNPTLIESKYLFGTNISKFFGLNLSGSKCQIDVGINVPIIGEIKKTITIDDNCSTDLNSTYQDSYMFKMYGSGDGNKDKQSGKFGISFLDNNDTVLKSEIKGIHTPKESNVSGPVNDQEAGVGVENNHLVYTIFSGYAPKGTEKMRFQMNGELHFGKINIYKCDNRSFVQFDKDNYSVKEDTVNPMPPTKFIHPIVKVLNAPLPYDVKVHYKTIENTAKSGEDFIPKEGNITIKKGETSVPLNIEIINDEEVELDESFYIQLSNPQPSLVNLNEHNRTKITILAQDDAPVCFEDDFEDYKLNNYKNLVKHGWRVLHNNNANEYTPKVVKVGNDKRLRLTDGSRNLATVVTKDYEFSTKNNLIIVEFDYYAYGGCGENHGGLGKYGADGIVNVLFNSNVGKNPQPGGLGGSLGYAQNPLGGQDNGFQGGWIGLGIDEYGNFGNCNEGRIGGLENTSCDYNRPFSAQDHTNTAVIRGDGNKSEGYEFLKGVEFANNKFHLPPVAKKYSDNYFSGRYKLIIDARSKEHLYMSLTRDTNITDNIKPVSIIDKFDAKDPKYNQGSTPDLVRYAITAGTGGGCNNHEISWIRLKGNCRKYEIIGNYKSGPFLAVDTFRWEDDHLKDSFDQAISTKIVGKPFKLILASMAEDGKTSQTKNGINVAYGLFDGKKLISINGNNKKIQTFNAWKNPFIQKEFKINKSYKKLKVRFFYCGYYDKQHQKTTIYPLYKCKKHRKIQYSKAVSEGTKGLHLFYRDSDPFAVKPNSFDIDINKNNLKAGEDFNITFKAKDFNEKDVKDFNETSGNSFKINITESKANSCIVGNFKPSLTGWKFKNGLKKLRTKYNEVGDIILSINDQELPCSKRFAKIDCHDKNINGHWNNILDTSIGSASINNILIKPHHFKIDADFNNFDKNNNFTYISNNLNMSAILDLNISALNKDNNITTNYNKQCYSKNIDINIDLNHTANITLPNRIIYKLENCHSAYCLDNRSSENLNKINMVNIPNDIFDNNHKGQAITKVKINFNREYNIPINPFKLFINSIKIKDSDNLSKTYMLNKNVNFYYARATSAISFYDDITEDSVVTPIEYHIYCDKNLTYCKDIGINVDSASTNKYNWWINTRHTFQSGRVGLTTDSNLSQISTNFATRDFNNGVDNSMQVDALSNNRPFVVKIKPANNTINNTPWLLYNPNLNSAPAYLFRVRFVSQSDMWSGLGDSGFSTDVNSTIGKKNRKIDW